MGLFFNKKEKGVCSICNEGEGVKNLEDGFICKDCISKCAPFINDSILINWKLFSKQKVNNAIAASEINQHRANIFQKTQNAGGHIEIDTTNQLWKASSLKNVIFEYKDILDFELLENGKTVTKGGLGSAVVGGVLFGGVGAVVGSVAGKKTKQEITEYRIKITTNNPFYPSVYINLLSAGSVKSDSFIHKANTQLAQDMLSALTQMTKSQPSQPETSGASVADEILKLKQLADSGIITQDEFEQKKKQLLAL